MLQELLNESTGASSIEFSRPTLVSLTRKTNEKVYRSTVVIQPTKSPVATVYGMRVNYDTPNGEYDALLDNRTSGGRFAIGDAAPSTPNANNVAGDIFSVEDYYFEVLIDGDYSALTTAKSCFDLVYRGSLRLVAEGIARGDEDQAVSESRFILNRWSAEVRSRKIKTPISLELIQDMEKQGLDGNLAIEEMLSTIIADEINSDIISKLVCVATKELPLNVVNTDTTYYRGREILDKICMVAAEIQWTTSVKPNYVVASADVYGIIKASGQIDDDGFIKGTELELLLDGRALGDYVMVGASRTNEDDEMDSAAGIFYSPYMIGDDIYSFLATVDYDSLQPVIGIMTRYALSAFPTYEQIKSAAKPNGDDWVKLANSSKFVTVIPIILE